MRRSLLVLTLAAAISLPLGLKAAETEQPKKETATYDTKTATVLEVNQAERTLVLQGEGGTRIETKLGPQVKNFNNIKKGDLVKIQTMESMVLTLTKKDKGEKPSAEMVEVKETAPVGSKPSVENVKTWLITAEVVSVDQAKSWLELKGPKGNVMGFKVKDTEKLKDVKKGDMVAATYTDSLTISVEPMPK